MSALCAPNVEAAKLYQLADATVYLKDGTTDQYSGATKLSMPHKSDALQKVENAYTKKQKKGHKPNIRCMDLGKSVKFAS